MTVPKISIVVTIKTDPMIGKMAQLSVTHLLFRQRFCELISSGKAFEYKSGGKNCLVLHASDLLLESYYSAMGV